MATSDSDNDSWLNVPATRDITPWSDESDTEQIQAADTAAVSEAPSSYVASAPSVASAQSAPRSNSMRHFRELNKRLKAIYAEEEREYSEPITDDDICERFREATSIRKTRNQKIFNGIRLAQNVDLLFLIDVTGSMQRHFNGARDAIFRIVNALLETDGETQVMKIRLGLLGYRDHTDSKQFERMEFTESAEEFRTYCNSIKCTGGGDAAEDVFGGIEQALKMNWDVVNSGTRLIFHICDSPAHGLDYHQPNMTDNYPGGDPKERKHEDLFKKMDEMEIYYHFGKINNTTDIMVAKFEKGRAEKISVFDVTKVENIASAVITAVNESVWTSSKRASTTGTEGHGKRLHRREYIFDTEEPNWDAIQAVKGTFLTYAPPRSLDDVIEDVPLHRQRPEEAQIQVAANPFAKGVERVAFYGRDLSPRFGGLVSRTVDVVFKDFAHVYRGSMSHRFETANQVQTIAAYMANRFCEDLRRRTGKRMTIEFLKTKTLVIQQDEGQTRYLACEKRFAPGTVFTRFSNNMDYAMLKSKAAELGVPADYVDLLMAFSHWTYQVTERMIMVVDLQGIVHRGADSTKIVLTDPAINCIDSTRYGDMNRGQAGMKNFFRRHKCNQFCKGLGLENVVEST